MLEMARTRLEEGKVLQSQQVIEHWIRLYNRLIGTSYHIASWPCADLPETSVDAFCTDNGGHLIALEHARVAAGLTGSTLEDKLLKLSAANADKRILLLESDLIAGSIEDQYARVRDEVSVRSLRSGVDEIWGVLTATLESDNVIFTIRIDPPDGDDCSLCSLNVITGEFWRLRGDRTLR
jgi:hypothetical protein